VVAGAVGAASFFKFFFQKDIARYNSLAEMSGDKPLVAAELEKLKRWLGFGRNGSHA